MLFRPKALGSSYLPWEVLSKDKKNCIKIGPCGLGEQAIYLNNILLDRIYYAQMTKVARIFKRVAMSKGGFTGKGLFGSIPYLVVQFTDGTEKVCIFKYEEQVDQLLEEVGQRYPNLPLHSVAAERRLKEAEEKERARYVKDLSQRAKASIEELEDAKKVLKKEMGLCYRMAHDAKQKRTLDSIHPTYRLLAVAVLLGAVVCAVWGIQMVMQEGLRSGGVYVLLGFAFIFFVVSSQALPTARNSKLYGETCYAKSLEEMEHFLQNSKGFPLPAEFAHPIVVDRMIRVIREGRAESIEDALKLVKSDLMALNANVTVSQKEYDEIVVVKPLFTVTME